MTKIFLHMKKYGALRGVMLHGRHKLTGSSNQSRIMRARAYEAGWIFLIFFNIVKRGIPHNVFKVSLTLIRISVFFFIGKTLPQHIRHWSTGNDSAKKLWFLDHRPQNKKPAIAVALRDKSRRRGIVVFDEVLRAGNKIIKHILFIEKPPLIVPFLPEFSAAADISMDVYAT